MKCQSRDENAECSETLLLSHSLARSLCWFQHRWIKHYDWTVWYKACALDYVPVQKGKKKSGILWFPRLAVYQYGLRSILPACQQHTHHFLFHYTSPVDVLHSHWVQTLQALFAALWNNARLAAEETHRHTGLPTRTLHRRRKCNFFFVSSLKFDPHHLRSAAGWCKKAKALSCSGAARSLIQSLANNGRGGNKNGGEEITAFRDSCYL